ncbi:MAG: DUF1574 family protein [Cyanobacteriota/Melainabacteria group bacterium]
MTENMSRSKTQVIVASKAVAALVAFALLCCIFSVLQVGSLAPETFQYPTWTSWKVGSFRQLPDRANLVFLGSSLVHTPMGEADADLTKTSLDATIHHKSLVFEKRFQELTGTGIRTFSFALPGEMPSDAYLITKFLLKGERRPDVIVYGVGPRDFLENTLPDPSSTDPFRYLSRFGDYSEHLSLIKPGFISRFDYELGRLFYPYGKKEDLQIAALRWTENLISSVLPSDIETFNVHQRKQVLPEYHPYEVRRDEAFYHPDQSAKTAFKDNLAEYRYRYKNLKWDTFKSQSRFFEDMLKVASGRGIHVVVVAMPITDQNRDLLKPEAKQAYIENLATVTRKQGASFIDLDASPDFELADFADSVHLRSKGGKKFFDLIAEKLSGDRAVLAALDTKPKDTQRALAEREDSRL